jgi:hypothetical protein
LTALVYRDILEQALLPSVLPIFRKNFVFQQDNCPSHTAHLIRDFLQTNEVTTLDWPARSSDLNPIENIWGIMAKEINTKILPQNRQELIQSISDTWEQISVDCVQRTVLSMPRRLQMVIDGNGDLASKSSRINSKSLGYMGANICGLCTTHSSVNAEETPNRHRW